MSEPTFRKARSEDLPQILAFERMYIEEIEPEHLDRWLGSEMNVRSQLERSLGRTFVAEAGHDLLGHAYWAVLDGTPHIHSIFVLDSNRRQGIAARLMELAEADMSRSGHQRCKLATRQNNPAKLLFESAGYEVIGLEHGWYQLEKLLGSFHSTRPPSDT